MIYYMAATSTSVSDFERKINPTKKIINLFFQIEEALKWNP